MGGVVRDSAVGLQSMAKKSVNPYPYEEWTREKLLKHIKARDCGIHQFKRAATNTMTANILLARINDRLLIDRACLRREVQNLKRRLAHRDKVREVLHG